MDAKQGDKKPQKTLSEVLNVNRDVFERARALLPSLPEGGKRGATPATLAEAMAQIQERQLSQQASKDPKAKSKAGPAQPAEQAVPGARIGGSVPNSAFWTLVEVRHHAAQVCAIACCWPLRRLAVTFCHQAICYLYKASSARGVHRGVCFGRTFMGACGGAVASRMAICCIHNARPSRGSTPRPSLQQLY